MALTPRGRALRWCSNHRGLTEQPAFSNGDKRKDGITAAIRRCGFSYPIPRCGAWMFNALTFAGVKGLGSWMASVYWIERKARAKEGPFHGWHSGPFSRKQWEHTIFRGDLVVLFGEGKHVALLRDAVFDKAGRLLGVWTDEGNTSPGNAGSQDNGGGSYKRFRPASQIHGIARVNYPG